MKKTGHEKSRDTVPLSGCSGNTWRLRSPIPEQRGALQHEHEGDIGKDVAPGEQDSMAGEAGERGRGKDETAGGFGGRHKRCSMP